MKPKPKVDSEALQKEYLLVEPIAKELCEELAKQLQKVFDEKTIALGYPIQCRVKKWSSIAEKFNRIKLKVKTVKGVQDLLGIRATLLFKRDVDKVAQIIKDTFQVLKQYNTQDSLREDQFGYSSLHFIVKLKKEWLMVPTFSRGAEFLLEIQVRTLAQHIWAESSHKLQYKQEAGIPPSVRRSIHRVSALLEMVDLEFERVLQERDLYRSIPSAGDSSNETLNVDLLERILDDELNKANKGNDENLSELLEDLKFFKIDTKRKIMDLFKAQKSAAVKLNDLIVADLLSGKQSSNGYMLRASQDLSRLKKGVFFTHTGMVRSMISAAVGDDKWNEYLDNAYTMPQVRESNKGKGVAP